MDYGCNHTRTSRNGHADEILETRPAWVTRLRVDADVEAREAAGSADKKQETDNSTEVLQTIFNDGITGRDHLTHSPEICEEAGRHSEGYDVCERVQFAPEGAGRIGPPRDAAVQAVDDAREAESARRAIKA